MVLLDGCFRTESAQSLLGWLRYSCFQKAEKNSNRVKPLAPRPLQPVLSGKNRSQVPNAEGYQVLSSLLFQPTHYLHSAPRAS